MLKHIVQVLCSPSLQVYPLELHSPPIRATTVGRHRSLKDKPPHLHGSDGDRVKQKLEYTHQRAVSRAEIGIVAVCPAIPAQAVSHQPAILTECGTHQSHLQSSTPASTFLEARFPRKCKSKERDQQQQRMCGIAQLTVPSSESLLGSSRTFCVSSRSLLCVYKTFCNKEPTHQ